MSTGTYDYALQEICQRLDEAAAGLAGAQEAATGQRGGSTPSTGTLANRHPQPPGSKTAFIEGFVFCVGWLGGGVGDFWFAEQGSEEPGLVLAAAQVGA